MVTSSKKILINKKIRWYTRYGGLMAGETLGMVVDHFRR